MSNSVTESIEPLETGKPRRMLRAADILRTNRRSPIPEAERFLAQPRNRLADDVVIKRLPTKIALDDLNDRRPIWVGDRLPIQYLEPIDLSVPTVVVDKFTIRPTKSGIVYVAPSQLALVGFSLTLRRNVLADRSIAITGGTAILSLSVYTPDTSGEIALQRVKWNDALTVSHVAKRDWIYRAEPQRGMWVTLELPPGVATADPLIATSPLAGAATVAIDLTEMGALSWKSALEQSAGSAIPGILHVTTSAPAVDNIAFRVNTQTFDTPIGSLLANKTSADISYIDPQQTIMGTIVVITSELVTQSTLSVTPTQGEAPTSRTFGAAGGQLDVAVTTQNVDSVAMNWSAQVAFNPTGWPIVPISGRLTSANGWVEMIKPGSWLASYLLMVVPVDSSGHAQPAPAGGQLQGVLNFTAPYVSNGLLNTSFFAEYLQPVNVALPRYPNQSFGELVLTMFVTRDGLGGTASRRLAADDLNVVVLVYPDARVEIRTTADALPETSAASEILGIVGALNL